MPRRTLNALSLSLLATLLAPSAYGEFAMPVQVPIDRLITNTEAYIKEHPKDASGYYILARVHYLAVSRKADAVGIYGTNTSSKTLPSVAADERQGSSRAGKDGPGKPLTDDQLAQHAKAAAENYRKAIDMDPKNDLYHLGYASLLDAASRIGPAAQALAQPPDGTPEAKVPPELFKALSSTSFKDRADATEKLRAIPNVAPALIKQLGVETDNEAKSILNNLIGDILRVAAMKEYVTAFNLAKPDDIKRETQPLEGSEFLVSYEAAYRYQKLGEILPAFSDKEIAKEMAEVQKTLLQKPMGGITPIIFSMEKDKQLNDLLSPGVTTRFDLDGTGRGFAWPWVKPTTAILAWDPNHTGKITSGWQLFGSVTFDMIWPDGYRALDALDDNRDGVLSGDELKGLVIWYDRNGDGVSDPGEVVPIEKTGITSIKVHPDVPTSGDEKRTPTAAKGLTLENGQTLRTWDWITTPGR